MSKLIVVIFLISIVASCTPIKKGYDIMSPDGQLHVGFSMSPDHMAQYMIERNGTLVLKNSHLGLIRNDGNFVKGLKLVSATNVEPFTESYTMKTGKRKDRSYRANEQTFRLTNASGDEMDITFRVSNDGVAFRYHFPGRSTADKVIEEEETSFNFPDSAKAWLQPMDVAKTGWDHTNPSYEEDYMQGIAVGTPSPSKAGWVFPALFKSGPNWVVITEAGLDSTWCASRLQQVSTNGDYRIGFPEKEEVFPGGGYKPISKLPWSSPWRIIAVGPLKTIMESTLGTDLAKPAVKMDTSFIKPGRASWSWALLKDNSIKYDVQKRFIDYASDMHWQYCLIDVNWDTTIGYNRIAELAKYAARKNVGLILWYNSSGSWNTTTYHPKSKLLTHADREKEFGRLERMGIKGIKVDFFGGDGQSMIKYYQDILKDAAAYHLLVNFHGATLPRGWERTWPNLMTMEAVRGFEYITFNQQDADREANHCAMLPFTRNIFDPMDFTPMCLYKIPHIERETTDGFELALPVIFTSGIQHFAETPEGMSHMPDYVKDFLRKVPVHWDDTRFIAGYPGDLVVLARKSPEGSWYLAGINGEDTTKTVTMNLPFLHPGQQGTLITDSDSQLPFEKQDITLPADRILKVNFQRHGGFVIVWRQK